MVQDLGKLLGSVLLNRLIKCTPILESSNSILIYSREMKTCPQTDICKVVYSSLIHKNPKLETTQMFILIIIYHNGTVLSNKKEWTNTGNFMNESQKCYVKQK